MKENERKPNAPADTPLENDRLEQASGGTRVNSEQVIARMQRELTENIKKRQAPREE